jgi:hypothetical protein
VTCSEWQDRFSDIYEGRGDQALSAAFGEHLRRCAACRTAYDDFQAVWSGLDSLARVEPANLPPGFHASLLARIEQEQLERTLSSRKALRARLSELFFGRRSPKTTLAYAAVAVGIVLCLALIPNPLRDSGARLLGFGPDTQVVTPVKKGVEPKGPRAEVDKAPPSREDASRDAMPTGGELCQPVEVGWSQPGDSGVSPPHITLLDLGTESVEAAVELLAEISPSPDSAAATRASLPRVLWAGKLAVSEPVEIALSPLGAEDAWAARLLVRWGSGDHFQKRYVFLPIQPGGQREGNRQAIALHYPAQSTDYALASIAAQAGMMIVADRSFEGASGVWAEGLAVDEALRRQIVPLGCSFRFDRDKRIIYIEGNGP